VRELGGEFSRRYPETAARLALSETACADPHVERLIEVFAFLSARIRLKLDDDLPEITDPFLELLWPNQLAPVPSLLTVQLEPAVGRGKLKAPHTVPVQRAIHSPDLGEGRCEFRTCYPVTLWPIQIVGCSYLRGGSTPAAKLTVDLACTPGTSFGELPLEELRLHLHGDAAIAHRLHEALLADVVEIEVSGVDRSGRPARRSLPPSRVRPVGYESSEALLPGNPRSFPGYRLLQEYFVYPRKFLFVDLTGLDAIRAAELEGKVSVTFLLGRVDGDLERHLRPDHFRLGATPAVNLFPKTMASIPLSHREAEYLVVPDDRRRESFEVFSVDEVSGSSPDADRKVVYRPFYSLRHGESREGERAFWCASRRPSMGGRSAPDGGGPADDVYRGTEVFLSFVDDAFEKVRPDRERVDVRATCSNRGRPTLLAIEEGHRGLRIEGESGVDVRVLDRPTRPLAPLLRGASRWRLISSLALNHLSLDSDGGRPLLQEVLAIHTRSDNPSHRRQIEGLASVACRSAFRRIPHATGSGFGRGLEVRARLDEQGFVGGSPYLFASVLERFLSLYASVNSFTQFTAEWVQQSGREVRWAPRAGERTIL
jgi:type VI secretion system protein ImpG